ncbi:hypothetical protein G7054_g14524 [Neopestalotiopsis clavispora]|nr:hypothetical protein G7054_g14524 [Neopestalotiopsis clavispora]
MSKKAPNDKGKSKASLGTPTSVSGTLVPAPALPCNHMSCPRDRCVKQVDQSALVLGFEGLAAQRDKSRADTLAGRPDIGKALELEGFHRNSEAPKPNVPFEPHNLMYNSQHSYNTDPVLFSRFLSQAPENRSHAGPRDNPQNVAQFLAAWGARDPNRPLPSIEHPSRASSVASRLPTVERLDISGHVQPSIARTPSVVVQNKATFVKQASNIPAYPVSLRDVIHLWTSQADPKDPRRDPMIDKVFKYLVLSVCDGGARDRYLRWEITDDEFWTCMHANSSVTNEMTSTRFKEKCRVRPLFAEINEGSPYGRILHQMTRRATRVTGLFVQMYGEDNMVPCSGCETRLRSSESQGGRDGARGGMYPFFGCRSIPGFMTNQCGNCIMSVVGHECEFQHDQYAVFRASFKNRKESDLDSNNSPVLIRFRGSTFTELQKAMDKRYGKAI